MKKRASEKGEQEEDGKALDEDIEKQKKEKVAAEAEHAQQIRERGEEADGQRKQMQALQQETMTTEITQMEQKIMEV